MAPRFASRTKSIVITGASSGIGAALTRSLASDGHRLFVCARRADLLTQVTKGFDAAFHATCDVSREADVEAFFLKVEERMPSVDVLIHCAGIAGPVGTAAEADSEEWLATLRTNLFGAFLTAKHVLPLMRPEARPRILLTSGGGAFDPMPNLSAYGVSKAGIVRLAETLAIELAPRNIAVNVFAPGFVSTEIFNPILDAGPERAGELYNAVTKLMSEWSADEIDLPVECVRFLISDLSADLTGKTISARFDPWDDPEFHASLADIVASKLYSTQRTNLEHIKDKAFVARLAQASKDRKPMAQRKIGT